MRLHDAIVQFLSSRTDGQSYQYVKLDAIRDAVARTQKFTIVKFVLEQLEDDELIESHPDRALKLYRIAEKPKVIDYIRTDLSGSYRTSSSPSTEAKVLSHNSLDWTGLPRQGVLGEGAVKQLKTALAVVDDAVSKCDASNEEKAQARAYVLAIHALADAPEPPADLIWELVSRANQISGIASLFVSLMALYVTVSQ